MNKKQEIKIKLNNKYSLLDDDFVNEKQNENENKIQHKPIKKIDKSEIIIDKQMTNWEPVEKKYKSGKNKKKQMYKKNAKLELEEPELNTIDDGSNYNTNDHWYIWVHESSSSDWSAESYKKIFVIDTLKTFWQFFGNIDSLDLDKYQYYVMRQNSYPIWEHITNRNGGTCSIRITKDRCLEIIEQLAILIINDSFSVDNEINGLSFSVVHNWGVIKIWNKTSNMDSSKNVPEYMTTKYVITPRYKINEPEY